MIWNVEPQVLMLSQTSLGYSIFNRTESTSIPPCLSLGYLCYLQDVSSQSSIVPLSSLEYISCWLKDGVLHVCYVHMLLFSTILVISHFQKYYLLPWSWENRNFWKGTISKMVYSTRDVTLFFLVCLTKDGICPLLEKVSSHINYKIIFSLTT